MQIKNISLEPPDEPKYIVFHGEPGGCSITVPLKGIDLTGLLNHILNSEIRLEEAA